MVEIFRENVLVIVILVINVFWGDLNLMFNVKKSLFFFVCICIIVIIVSGSYRYILRREYIF